MGFWFCLSWFEQRRWQLWLSPCLWLKGTGEWSAHSQPLQLAAYLVFSGLSLVSCTEMWVWLQHVRRKDSVHWDNQGESIVRVRTGLCNRSMWVWALGLAVTSYVTLNRSLKLSDCLHLWGFLVKGLVSEFMQMVSVVAQLGSAWLINHLYESIYWASILSKSLCQIWSGVFLLLSGKKKLKQVVTSAVLL